MKQTKKTNEIVETKTNDTQTSLTPEMVKKYICEKANDKEIFHFLQVCKAQKLNPFLREAYLVKYSEGKPASIVTGKETFLKRATNNPKYQGHKAWVVGEGDNLVGRAEVYVKGYQYPICIEVHYKEYVNKMAPIWQTKPKTMLRKVALVQALREAFPDDFGGLYDSSEINDIEQELPSEPINITPQEKNEEETDWNIYKIQNGDHNGKCVSEIDDYEYIAKMISAKNVPLGLKAVCKLRLLELDKSSKE